MEEFLYSAIVHKKRTLFALHIHTASDDNDDDLCTCIARFLHAVVACSVRSVSFEACCQWALLCVKITRHYLAAQMYRT